MVEKKIITVQNAEGDISTKAEILIQNKIDYIPKVSVIIPVYNVEQYLHECLDSVVNQTLKEIEIICIDDGSTDNSLEILKEYAKKDKRITVIVQKNLHAGVARNAGLTVAKGEYLSFLDSDDFFELNMLEEMFNLSKKYKNDLTICRYKNFNNQTKTVEEIRGINQIYKTEIATISTKSIKKKIFTICNPMPWNKLIRKDFILDNGIRFQSLPVSNDVYFSMMSMACSKKITFYYKPLIFYRYNRKESARNIRDKHPFCFYYAYKQLYLSLKTRKLYNYYKKAFLTSLVSSSLWTLDNTDIMRNDVMKLIKDKIITEFDVFCGILPDWMSDKLKNKLRPELIISLTSYPARINTVNQVIESLLNQTMKADKVILWLAPEQFPNGEADLPEQLLALKEKGLTIDWYKDIRSYKKLIPTLKKYPEAIIVTADDDIIYPNNWLEKLYKSYKKNPKYIHANRAHHFTYNKHCIRYNDFINSDKLKNRKYKKFSLLPTTGGGILYPPNVLNNNVFDEEKAFKLCKDCDDIWFWINALLNKTKIILIPNRIKYIYEKAIQETQTVSLYSYNGQEGGGNDIALKNIFTEYPDLLTILKKEIPFYKTILDFFIRKKIVNNTVKIKLFNFIPLYERQKSGNNYTKKFYLLGLPIIILKKQDRKKSIKILVLPSKIYDFDTKEFISNTIIKKR